MAMPTSIFSSPFQVAPSDPDAFGSHTSCQGPSSRPHSSSVAKLKRHLAASFNLIGPQQSTGLVPSEEPVERDILTIPFVLEPRAKTANTPSKTPVACKFLEHPGTWNTLGPFGSFDFDILIMPFIATGDGVEQVEFDRKPDLLPSSAAAIAKPSSSTWPNNLLKDDTSTRAVISNKRRSSSSAVDGGCPLAGGGNLGFNACQSPCRSRKCQLADFKFCKRTSSRPKSRGKSKKGSNKL